MHLRRSRKEEIKSMQSETQELQVPHTWNRKSSEFCTRHVTLELEAQLFGRVNGTRGSEPRYQIQA